MPRLKKNVSPLLDKGIASLTLAISLFNRPTEIARTHGVPILMQHAFEMLLKACILQMTGSIHDREQRYTYGFDRCLAVATEQLEDNLYRRERPYSILGRQRDQAAHYYVEMSEDILYVHAQSGVTLLNTVLKNAFGIALSEKLPSRILPVSTCPPRDLVSLFSGELAQVDRLLTSGKNAKAPPLQQSSAPFLPSR